eukprot:Cvel_19341.t1-p1 / transcript=Cvel_19341.t1 / gene=Cvel_19341 / organism=Chromera_velia_CCMP2878 / gene_product=hypothetical protein / transcript_product=hypothetical protein / location=Cvel_scaffold1660:40371-41602(+) / protein_length=305 / sequence_SO=supercontig / SO=protein_coding / is_pseudo=false
MSHQSPKSDGHAGQNPNQPNQPGVSKISTRNLGVGADPLSAFSREKKEKHPAQPPEVASKETPQRVPMTAGAPHSVSLTAAGAGPQWQGRGRAQGGDGVEHADRRRGGPAPPLFPPSPTTRKVATPEGASQSHSSRRPEQQQQQQQAQHRHHRPDSSSSSAGTGGGGSTRVLSPGSFNLGGHLTNADWFADGGSGGRDAGGRRRETGVDPGSGPSAGGRLKVPPGGGGSQAVSGSGVTVPSSPSVASATSSTVASGPYTSSSSSSSSSAAGASGGLFAPSSVSAFAEGLVSMRFQRVRLGGGGGG